jgi:DNA-binding transcriptional LysR family regulator
MLNVTLRQFETLQLVVEEGSFSKAAQRLGISQPAISKHICALEAKLGFQLFERRRGNPVELTTRGSAVLAQVSSLLTIADSLDATSKQARRRQRRVRILAGRFLAQYVILPHLAQLQVERPDLVIELLTLESPLLSFDPSKRASADLIYFSVLDGQSAGPAEEICPAFLSFMASPSHPVLKDMADGADPSIPMIMGVPGDGCDSLIREALRIARIARYHKVHSVQLPEVMAALAIAGEGVCCVMRAMVKDNLARGTLVDLDVPQVTLRRCVLRSQSKLNDDLRYVDRFIRAMIVAAS